MTGSSYSAITLHPICLGLLKVKISTLSFAWKTVGCCNQFMQWINTHTPVLLEWCCCRLTDSRKELNSFEPTVNSGLFSKATLPPFKGANIYAKLGRQVHTTCLASLRAKQEGAFCLLCAGMAAIPNSETSYKTDMITSSTLLLSVLQ